MPRSQTVPATRKTYLAKPSLLSLYEQPVLAFLELSPHTRWCPTLGTLEASGQVP